MEVRMIFEEKDAGMARPRKIKILLRGDPAVVDMLRSNVNDFMKKQDHPSWEAK
jgi:hypothetical protein